MSFFWISEELKHPTLLKPLRIRIIVGHRRHKGSSKLFIKLALVSDAHVIHSDFLRY